jgi:hypothetical protein
LLSWAWPESEWPDWAQKARFKPFLENGAEALKNLVPGQIRDKSAASAGTQIDRAREAATERAIRALIAPAEKPAAAPTAPPSYKPAERRDMDRLFQSTQ